MPIYIPICSQFLKQDVMIEIIKCLSQIHEE